MTSRFKMTAAAATLALVLGSGTTAFGKAHDQGVADGEATPDNTGAFVQTLEAGVSTVVSDGVRGAGASAAGSDNAVEPVVGNGANEPD